MMRFLNEDINEDMQVYNRTESINLLVKRLNQINIDLIDLKEDLVELVSN